MVKKGKVLRGGRKGSEHSLPLSSDPSIQEDTSLSQLTASFSFLSSDIGSRNIGRQHSFLTSTRLFDSSDQQSIITNKSALNSFYNGLVSLQTYMHANFLPTVCAILIQEKLLTFILKVTVFWYMMPYIYLFVVYLMMLSVV